MASTKRHHKEKMIRQKEDKQEEPEVPKYRDRAKEHREDQNPDYEPTELGSFHAVAPPGTVDLRTADTHKIFIENRKYLGGSLPMDLSSPTVLSSRMRCFFLAEWLLSLTWGTAFLMTFLLHCIKES